MAKGRVLAVDDESGILGMLEEFLNLTGYHSFCASSAADALAILDKEAVDVLLADIRMPGMNGLELVRHVTERYPSTDVIFMTAYGSVEIAVEAMKLGAFDFVQKPFKIETIEGCLERCFDRRSLRTDVENENAAKRMVLLDRKMDELRGLKDEFIAITSHELLTPLTPLDGYLQVLRDGTLGELTTEQKGAVDVMIHEIHRLKVLIRNLLTLRDLAGGTYRIHSERVDLVSLLVEAIRETAHAAGDRGVKVRTELPAVCYSETDGSLLQRVFSAIVHNAIKFNKQGGQVVVRLESGGGKTRVGFVDEGIGIAADEHEAIFKEFYQVDRGTTRHYSGAGIGLTLAQRACKAMGAIIEVASEPGRGASFSICLPQTCSPDCIEEPDS